MVYDSLSLALREHGEALQYLAFFGLFFGLGLIEWVAGERTAPRGKRWRTNLSLTALCVLTIGALPVSALIVADVAAERGTGLLNDAAIPVGVAVVAGFLLRSLLSFLIHVAFHKSPWLWRLHAVHHTDTAMDITTAVRMHPLEFVVSALILLPCIMAFGIPAAAILLYEIFDAGMAATTHANIRLPRPIDRVLRWVLVTPAMHRIHHSTRQKETDSNFGATFSFWDRMFGSYRATTQDGYSPRTLGLTSIDSNQAAALGWLLALPVNGVPQETAEQGHMKRNAV